MAQKSGLSRAQWLGLSLGVLGMVILTWGKVDFKPGGSGLAVVAGLVATLAYGVSTHYTKRKLAAVSRWALRRTPDDRCVDAVAAGRHLLASSDALQPRPGSPPYCSRC